MTVAEKPAVRRAMMEDEFMRLPKDGGKWELVDGEAQEVPAGHEHDILVINIGAMLKPFARGRGFVSGSSAGFRMASGNVRSPDVSYMSKERLPEGRPARNFEGAAPDLAIEIISPSEDPDEMLQKVAEYFGAGARQVWHLFPAVQQVTVYFSHSDTASYGPEDELDAGDLLPGFSCRVEELFRLD